MDNFFNAQKRSCEEGNHIYKENFNKADKIRIIELKKYRFDGLDQIRDENNDEQMIWTGLD